MQLHALSSALSEGSGHFKDKVRVKLRKVVFQ